MVKKHKFLSPLQQTIRDFLIEQKHLHGTTQGKVAKAIKIGRENFNNLLTGANELRASHFQKLADFFAVSVIELLGGIEMESDVGRAVSQIMKSDNQVARELVVAAAEKGIDLLKKDPPESSISATGR